ncbi:CDP-glycerol glycerophosphotransferase family protein [Peribacillus frigoritolerans]|nr:CDP-glycerol glycerophosphotransferase family protein [Peribacillus frigoritolerans]
MPIAPDYMLVNSNFEKNLFLKNTGYTDKELMVTGLPNIDLYVKEQQNEKKSNYIHAYMATMGSHRKH